MGPTPTEEADLIERVAGGDADALADLYRAHPQVARALLDAEAGLGRSAPDRRVAALLAVDPLAGLAEMRGAP